MEQLVPGQHLIGVDKRREQIEFTPIDAEILCQISSFRDSRHSIDGKMPNSTPGRGSKASPLTKLPCLRHEQQDDAADHTGDAGDQLRTHAFLHQECAAQQQGYQRAAGDQW
jgi:hypothetical protein